MIEAKDNSLQFGLGIRLDPAPFVLPSGRRDAKRPAAPTVVVPPGLRVVTHARVTRWSAKAVGGTARGSLGQSGGQDIRITAPKGSHAADPVRIDWHLSERCRADRVTVTAQAGSRLTIIERIGGAAATARICSVIIKAESGSEVTHIRIQDLPKTATERVSRRADVARGAKLTWIDCCFGASVIDRSVTSLTGTDASVVLRRLVFGDGHRQVAADDLVRHLADRTSSELAYRGAAGESSRLINRARISIPARLSACRGNQKSDTIIHSPDAGAAVLPELEVGTGDVNCRHAASTGRVDREKIFYLRSRGLDEPTATRLVVGGFFAPVIAEMRSAGLAEMIECLIAGRFGQSDPESQNTYACP